MSMREKVAKELLAVARDILSAEREAALEDALEKLPRMSISDIASIVSRDWKNIYFGARPYLDAMYSMSKITDDYGMDSGRSIVTYFLSNAQAWRGPVAKAVKTELKKRIKR